MTSPRNRRPLTLHLSASQHAQVQAAADHLGMSPSDYALQVLLISAQEIGAREWTSGELGVISRQNRGKAWTEDELLERGLPLYWCEAWVRAQLAEGRTLRQIALLSESPARSVSAYLQREFGITSKVAAVAKDVQEEARELVAAGASRVQVAAQLGLSEASVGTYALGLPDERQKLLTARLEAARPFPATVQEISLRVFGGNAQQASKWAHEMLAGGHLFRARRGVYGLPTD